MNKPLPKRPDGRAARVQPTAGLILVIFLGLLALLATNPDFWDPFLNDPDLDPEEVVAAKREADEIAERHEEWVQYKLVALSTKRRPCIRCPKGMETVTVRAGEIYRYGITSRGTRRYKDKTYETLDVGFVVELKGDYALCKRSEVNKIIAYKFLPEAQKPEGKLIRPPGNGNRN